MNERSKQGRLVRLVVISIVVGLAVVGAILACSLIGRMIFGPAL
jgi:hypothetical protein